MEGARESRSGADETAAAEKVYVLSSFRALNTFLPCFSLVTSRKKISREHGCSFKHV